VYVCVLNCCSIINSSMTSSEKVASVSDSDNYDAQEVLKIIEEYSNGISVCKGKDIVVFFGLQQSGKSTTINALTLGPLRVVECDEWGNKKYAPPVGVPVEAAAKIGDNIVGCTIAPQGYELGNGMFALDTRGMLDRRNLNEMVAATLLTEIALKEAKSVRLVFLQRYSKFASGDVGMRDFGKMFGKLVKDDGLPALFLFNDYRGPLPGSGKERQDKVFEELRKRWCEIDAGERKEWNNTIQRILERLQSTRKEDFGYFSEHYNAEDLTRILAEGTMLLSAQDQSRLKDLVSIVTNDEEFKARDERTRYLSILRKAFNNGNSSNLPGVPQPTLGYIDPEDAYSINELKNKIMQLPQISFSSLDFSGYSKEVIAFHKTVGDNIHRLVHLLRGQELIQKYPGELVDKLLGEENKTIGGCAKALQDLKANGGNKDILAQYEKQYGKECISERIAMLEKEEAEARATCERLKGSVGSFENQKPVEHLEEWNVEGYHPQYHVVFESEAPFTVKNIELGEGTEPTEVNSKEPPVFDVVYSNGSAFKTVAHFGIKILQFGLSFVPGVPKFVDPVLGAVDGMMKVKSSGRITFSINPGDLPENRRSLEEMTSNAESWELKANKAKEDRMKYIQSAVNSVEERIRAVIEEAARHRETLEGFQRFRALVCDLLTRYSGMIKTYHKAATVLYDGSSGVKIIDMQDFLRLIHDISGNAVNAATDGSSVFFSEMDVSGLAKLLAEEFH